MASPSLPCIHPSPTDFPLQTLFRAYLPWSQYRLAIAVRVFLTLTGRIQHNPRHSSQSTGGVVSRKPAELICDVLWPWPCAGIPSGHTTTSTVKNGPADHFMNNTKDYFGILRNTASHRERAWAGRSSLQHHRPVDESDGYLFNLFSLDRRWRLSHSLVLHK